MKTPSLEEVKQKFKNAKEVRCIWDNKIYDISNWNIYYNEQDNSFFGAENEKDYAGEIRNYIGLFGVNRYARYAEIISYKEKKYELSETFVKELCKDQNIKQAFIREGIIEDDKLEVGKWYKHNAGGYLFIKEIQNYNVFAYGFCRDMEYFYNETYSKNVFEYLTLATPQEVENALINEAKKRGYEIGVDCIFGDIKQERKIISNVFKYSKETNALLLGSDVILFQGVWAEIIEETIEIKKSLILNTPNDLELGQLIRKMI